MAWDSEKRVQFALNFTDSRRSIYLDDLLPRVVALAEGTFATPTLRTHTTYLTNERTFLLYL